MAAPPSGVPAPVKPFLWVQSNSDTQFRAGLAVNAFETETIPDTPNNLEIQSVVIESLQQLHFNLYFWRNVAGINVADYDLDTYIGRVDLDLTVHGERLLGAGKYLLDVQLNVPILYINTDTVAQNQNSIICSLVNRGPGAKLAGDAGFVLIKIVYVPVG